MLIDFNKLTGNNSVDTVLHPREIFDVLPDKDEKFEEYLRDVQTDVLSKWFSDYREDKDVVIKMNTGSGKTVVGLLILKSCLNQKKGPAVYVAPDPYLVTQVIEEANSLGIEVTENQNDPAFLKGESILVINAFKLLNGKSIFGVGEVRVGIGSIVIDDAHACLDIAESQFSIKIPSNTGVYKEIFNVFRESIKQQSEVGLMELEVGEPNVNKLVPFWSWSDHKNEVLQILHKESNSASREYASLKFGWPLLKNCLELCSCVIGSDSLEIAPKFLPIHNLPSFNRAKNRIFMSATISDDSVLVSHFDIDSKTVLKAITPSTSNDIGERMIIVPQELNTSISDDDLKEFYKKLSSNHNVVIIVPSEYRARYWTDVADRIIQSRNLYDGVNELKKRHVGLVIVINKYDGIDLPKSACSVLVIDGLPDVRMKIDKIKEGVFQGNHLVIHEKIQKIEQGMGRGIRSKDDHCVVFLMGRTLINHLYTMDAINYFTPATRVQLELSNQLVKQIRGGHLEELNEVINYSLKRNKDWIKTSRSNLIKVKYDASVKYDERIVIEREAYNHALRSDYQKASNILLELINNEEDLILKGYLKQGLAEYINFYDRVEAQQILKSAVKDNSQVIHPIQGIEYSKLLAGDVTQAQEIQNFINNHKRGINDYILTVRKLVEQLNFIPGTSSIFEQAFLELANILGFKGQRPENEYKKGPDNLWSVGGASYFVIECKNGATTELISKKDCNQLNGSINWFENKYDESNQHVPIMVHKSNVFEYAASPNRNIRIINEQKLEEVKKGLQKLCISISESVNNVPKIDELIKTLKFNKEEFINTYTVPFKINK